MPNNIPITPGSGAEVATDLVSGVNFQVAKLDIGAPGVSIPLVGTAMNGLPVDVTRVQGSVQVTATAPLPVDASGHTVPIIAITPLPVYALKTSPASVRLSDGTNNVDVLPVSGNVSAAQGTATNPAGAWPVKITDGTNLVGVTGTGLNVNVTSGAGGGADQPDATAFTLGSSDLTPVGGVFNDSPTDPSSGQAAVARITQKRGLHVNLRNTAGTEIGTSGVPVRTDPTGSTIQPVSGTVQGDITKVNGTTISAANPLPVSTFGQTTRVSKAVGMTASQTATTVWTPASGKEFVITSLILTITVTGALTIFDSTSSAANMLYQGTPPVGCFQLSFPEGWQSSLANNVLKYTSGTGLTGDLTLKGFEV